MINYSLSRTYSRLEGWKPEKTEVPNRSEDNFAAQIRAAAVEAMRKQNEQANPAIKARKQ